MTGTEIRNASALDATAIAALHARSWREAYRGVLPDAYLDGALARDLDRQWRMALDRPRSGDLVLVADAGGVIGFIAVWPDPDDPRAGFIDNLHVDSVRRGAGLGQALMGAAATRLAAQGRTSAYLWVVEANARAIRFYRRLGGVASGRANKPIHNHPVTQIRFVWQDLEVLAVAREQP